MRNNSNKQCLSHLLSTFNLGDDVTVECRDDGVFSHDEANVTMISYMLQSAEEGKKVVRILSDDSDVFFLLVYFTWRHELPIMVEMEKWDGVILNINATCTQFGPSVCSQLLGAHAVTGCDTVSYPFGKGKITVLRTLMAGDFHGV